MLRLLLPLLAMPLFLALLRLWRRTGHGSIAFAIHLVGVVTGLALTVFLGRLMSGGADVALELLVLVLAADVAVVSALVLAVKRWPADGAGLAGS